MNNLPGNLQLVILGIAGLLVVLGLSVFADRPPYTAPVDVDNEYEP